MTTGKRDEAAIAARALSKTTTPHFAVCMQREKEKCGLTCFDLGFSPALGITTTTRSPLAVSKREEDVTEDVEKRALSE